MASAKGFRTFFWNAGMTLVMGGSVQTIDVPPNVRMWLTLGIAIFGLGGMLLRLFTTTPVGQSVETKIEAAAGITPEQMAALVAKLPQAADMNAIVAQVGKVESAVADVKASTAATHEAVRDVKATTSETRDMVAAIPPPVAAPAAAPVTVNVATPAVPSPTDASGLVPQPTAISATPPL